MEARMGAITVLTDAFLIDCTGKEPVDGAAVVIEGERVTDVIPSGKGGPPQGAGGADYGFREAVASGLFPGPRMLVSGNTLSQTGGHGDRRRRSEWIEPVECCLGMVHAIADGPDEVRKAAREQLRHDVDQIKIMASGGAMSPSDELDTTQYTVEEMRAAVEEARAVGKYVLAHAYSGAAIRNALAAGVRSIEHGNLLDEAGAREIPKAGAQLVPHMGTSQALWRG